jgi:hypothetical protein
MKNFLVTWYGITDFKSSLGFEKSGPILGALTDGDYTDVIVLGYTKHDDSISSEEFKSKLKEARDSEEPDAKFKFTYEYANCSAAHKHFINFIEGKISEMGKTVSVGLISVSLSELNDSEGIYSAAVQALQYISDQKIECRVSIFLSPGTPLMAFSWALAAFKFPGLSKRLIASSDPRKPPVPIMPPKEWLAWNSKQNPNPKDENKADSYDVIYTLFGEQRIPALLGVNHFDCKKHVFVSSGSFDAECMKQFLPEGCEFSQIKADPYNPSDVFDKIIQDTAGLAWDARIGFNLTGGTKLMYAGAMNACRKLGGVPFYVGGKELKITYLNDFMTEDLKPIKKVESFILLNSNGLRIGDYGRSGADDEDSIAMTDEMWKARNKINYLYKDIQEIKKRDCYYSLSLENPTEPEIIPLAQGPYCVSTKYIDYAFEDETQFSTYIKGGWFEEYVYNHLYPLYEKGKLLDIRHGIKVDYNKATSEFDSDHYIYQEMDVVFTNGKRLFIVECKSGRPEIEHIEKLSTIVRYYGGIEGKGILAYSRTPDSDILEKKIKETPNVEIVSGDDLIEQIKKIIGCEND